MIAEVKNSIIRGPPRRPRPAGRAADVRRRLVPAALGHLEAPARLAPHVLDRDDEHHDEPLSATISSDGTFTAICIALPPTSRPPKTNDDTIVHSGFSPPNSATTIPLKPAEPVKPVRAVGDHPVGDAPEHQHRPGEPAHRAAQVIARPSCAPRHPGVPGGVAGQPDGPQAEAQLVRHSRKYAAIAASTAKITKYYAATQPHRR